MTRRKWCEHLNNEVSSADRSDEGLCAIQRQQGVCTSKGASHARRIKEGWIWVDLDREAQYLSSEN